MAQHPLFQFTPDDEAKHTIVTIDPTQRGTPPSKEMIGSFYEPLGHGTLGVVAELLVNPTFTRDHYLPPIQLERLRQNGKALVQLYLDGIPKDGLDADWYPQIMSTGFGLSLLDDASEEGLPLGWSPLGYEGAASSSLGRLGESVRLQGGDWPEGPSTRWEGLDEGPAGIRQGLFVPIRRCQTYHGKVWLRIASTDQTSQGEVEIGFRRRISTRNNAKCAGEILDSVRMDVAGKDWLTCDFHLSLEGKHVAFGEPVDFYIRWLPRSNNDLNLLIDRAELYPDDAVDGFDPEIVQLSRDWPIPLFRWPGGNFVSFFRWRDGIGPADLRPTIKNHAWGGLEYNLFGTDEFIRFCRLIGAEPHITVNSGTGDAQEAANWVEYCNGDITTPMGKLRAENGHPEPYNVVYWEVGNENFGFWQGGVHGSDENARRFALFAKTMRAASPIPIKLIACGNGFDFAEGGKGYDYATADGRWHEQLLKQAPDEIDYISLHSMPSNTFFLKGQPDDVISYAMLGQVSTWENRFLPELLQACDQATAKLAREPIKLAITEWAPVGENLRAVHIENFGSVIYGGVFMNMMIRNAERIPIANTTGYMHGGCLRRAFGIPYFDPQYMVIQEYQRFIDAVPLACHVQGPAFDIEHPSDIGHCERDLPYIDVVACLSENETQDLLIAIANKHLHQALSVILKLPDDLGRDQAEIRQLAFPRVEAYVTPADPDRFAIHCSQTKIEAHTLELKLAPFSVTWLKI